MAGKGHKESETGRELAPKDPYIGRKKILQADQAVVQDWSQFEAGDRVTVAEFGNPPYEATVVLTSDLNILWILPDTGWGRKVFDGREDVAIRHIDSTA